MAKRLNLEVSDDLYHWLKGKAERDQTTMADIFRKSFAVLKAAARYIPQGYHMGFTANPNKLDIELIGLHE